ncbi:MAG TPA: 5-methyltetrahydropteroyltriglutamate--homocysteine S-methyltransferase [Xanthobacteraceae bacterium]|jgi:5-methyltetrahydropteroyltriglutamate--homocysteine methyltransferase|nr:5-methyltetrahydropteroyltriglutamate--homocysteine S-methyltransferase [Xanthobacteraceae bacterium]
MVPRGSARPPFRADHVGSLLRPPALRQAFRQHGAGEIDEDAYRAVQDRCIRAAVAMQEAVGLAVVTDGEFRRGSYWGRFVERIQGFAIRPASFKFRDDAGHEVAFTAPYAVGPIRRAQPLALDEFAFLHGITRAAAKITLPAPSTMHFYRCSDFAAPKAYQDVDAFFADLAVAFRVEIAALGAAGCRYLQLDEVAVALLCDPAIRTQVEAAGSAPDRLVDRYIDAINQAVAGRPADMIVGVHMCRGNFKGHYLAAGGYGSVAERFFATTDVDHFLLEYDTPRAGDFAPLRFVPKDKGVVLGLVSTKTPVLEDLDALKRRVDEAAHVIDFDRLAIGPQCGFASTAAGNPLSEADQRAKLTLVVRAAAEIWNK